METYNFCWYYKETKVFRLRKFSRSGKRGYGVGQQTLLYFTASCGWSRFVTQSLPEPEWQTAKSTLGHLAGTVSDCLRLGFPYPETRIGVQIVYLRSDPRKHRWEYRIVKEERQILVENTPTSGLFPWVAKVQSCRGCLGGSCTTCLSTDAHPKMGKLGIHSLAPICYS